MQTIKQLCETYAWLYSSLSAPQGTWDVIFPIDGSYCALKSDSYADYIMFRGSTTFLDWVEDFEHFAAPCDDPVLGPVHPGFRQGVLNVLPQIESALTGRAIVAVGHSLGAGHAAIFSGYMAAKGKPIVDLLMWGEPRPGGPQLSSILQKASVNIRSLRNGDKNGHDLVTDVPFSLPPLLPYSHAGALQDCSASPRLDDDWGPFRYHRFGLYCRALGATGQAISTLPT